MEHPGDGTVILPIEAYNILAERANALPGLLAIAEALDADLLAQLIHDCDLTYGLKKEGRDAEIIAMLERLRKAAQGLEA